jgi:hypothetical protein
MRARSTHARMSRLWMPHAQRCQYRTAHRRRPGAVAAARWKHGIYSAEARAEQKRRPGEGQYARIRTLFVFLTFRTKRAQNPSDS